MINGAFLGAGVDENGNPILIKVNDQSHLPIYADDIPDLDASKITTGTFDPDRLGSGTQNEYTFLNGLQEYAQPLSGFVINPHAPPYNVTGDGVTDDRVGVIAAIAAAALLKATVEFKPGSTYYFSKYVGIIDSPDVRIRAYGASFIHASPTTVLPTVDANALTPAHVLSCFYVLRSNNVRIEGGTYTTLGDNTDVVNAYSGAGVYIRESSDVFLGWLSYRGKSAMVQMDESDTLTTRNIVAFCNSYGARRPCTGSDDVLFIGCGWDQPLTADYDRVGVNGSSHALYFFAGRSNVKVTNCHFKNIRETGVKFSGSSTPINNVIVSNNTFVNIYKDCILFGADDVQDHTSANIFGNTFYNCLQTSGALVNILGSRAVSIRGNIGYWDAALPSATGRLGFNVARWIASTPQGQVVESAIVEGNILAIRRGTGYITGGTSSTVLSYGVFCSDIGTGIDYSGSVQVKNNYIGVGAVGIYIARCIGPIVESNVLDDIATPMNTVGNRIPVIRNNEWIPGTTTTLGGVKIKMNRDSFPIIEGNFSTGLHRTAAGTEIGKGRAWSLNDNNNGTTIVDFPLLGASGLVTPTDGKSEWVFAYGDGWTDGDTVNVNGTTVTYKTTSPGATEFNTPAGLITLIDAIANIDAADYGAPWSITTNHIRIRRTTASATTFTVIISCANRTAGVSLANGTVFFSTTATAVAGQATGSRVLIWSAKTYLSAFVDLMPVNSAAAALLAANGMYEVALSTDHDGVVSTIDVGTTGGTEQWRWRVS